MKPPHFLFSSDAKLLLAASPTLTQLIIGKPRESTDNLFDQLMTEEDESSLDDLFMNMVDPEASESEKTSADKHPTLFSDEQLQAAWEGPYHEFFKEKFSVYAQLSKQYFQDYTQHKPAAGPARSKPATPELHAIIDQFKAMEKQLDHVMNQHYIALQNELELSATTFIHNLKAQGISLSDETMESLKQPNPLPNLREQISALNPKHPLARTTNRQNYWSLKIYLALKQSTPLLNESTIQENMHHLHNSFEDRIQKKLSLLHQQTVETQALAAKIQRGQ